ncbi:MAG: DNA polymerase III subunit gamma/tau [Phycisphaerales bacterium]
MARKTKDIEATEPAGDGLLIPGAIEPAPKGYTVLARRYRSRSFDELIGQESIARTLQNAISMGRTAHAYLFCGTRGVGKTSMARVFARALNASSDLQQAEAVGASILRGEDLDVIEIDGASNRGVDDARDLISKAGIAPARSPYRIYIIDEVHMLTTPAFNALLKTMEEPPSHVKFILCTTEPHKVPATIQSRCQRFDFRPIATGRIVEHLKAVLKQEGLGAEDAAVHLVARLGNGSMRDALSLLDRLIAAASGTITSRLAEETLGLPDAALVAAISAAAAAGDPKAGLQAAARLLESGSPVEQSLELLASRLRDLLVIRACGADSDLVELAPEARAQAATEAQAFESAELVHLVAVCEAALRAARSSSAPRTVLDATVARICLHRAFEPIDTAADQKKKVVEAERPVLAGTGRAPEAAHRPAVAPSATMREPVAPPKPYAPAPVAPVGAGAASAGSMPPPRDAAEAWSRIGAIATSPRDAALHEAFEPQSLDGQVLRLRAADGAGMGGAFASRRTEPLLELVRRGLGPAWRVAIDAPAEAGEAPAPRATHGLDAGIPNHPLVREAMDAFDAIVLKVDRRAGASPAPMAGETEADA